MKFRKKKFNEARLQQKFFREKNLGKIDCLFIGKTSSEKKQRAKNILGNFFSFCKI